VYSARHSLCSVWAVDMLLALIFLLLATAATMPVWGYSRRWKMYPSSVCFGIAALVALLIVEGAL
jgi:hypothetical protein